MRLFHINLHLAARAAIQIVANKGTFLLLDFLINVYKYTGVSSNEKSYIRRSISSEFGIYLKMIHEDTKKAKELNQTMERARRNEILQKVKEMDGVSLTRVIGFSVDIIYDEPTEGTSLVNY